MLCRDTLPLRHRGLADVSTRVRRFQVLGDLGGATETDDEGFDVHDDVKSHLTNVVKWELTSFRPTQCTVAVMYTDDGKFTEEHKLAMAKRMRQALQLSGLTQSAVAGRIGVSRAAMSQFCSKGGISIETLAKFCQVTKGSMDYMVFGTAPDMEASLVAMLKDMVGSRAKVTSN